MLVACLLHGRAQLGPRGNLSSDVRWLFKTIKS